MLIAALPLQGSAFAFMPCSNVEAPRAVAQHCEEMAAVVLADGADEPNQDAGLSAGAHEKCSHCAICSAGTAAPPAVPTVVLPAAFSSSVLTSTEPAMIAHIPATPKRPPRRLA
jgi:hypothetical protein